MMALWANTVPSEHLKDGNLVKFWPVALFEYKSNQTNCYKSKVVPTSGYLQEFK